MFKQGQYYYRLHRSLWAVFQAGEYIRGTRIDTLVKTFDTKEEAEREVYIHNGWKLKPWTMKYIDDYPEINSLEENGFNDKASVLPMQTNEMYYQ